MENNHNDLTHFAPQEMLSPFNAIKETDGEWREWWNSQNQARGLEYVPQKVKLGAYDIQHVPEKSILGTY
jgi:hypothetical protein